MQVGIAVQAQLKMLVEIPEPAQLAVRWSSSGRRRCRLLPLRDECDLVNLPTAHRVRDGEVHIGVSRWIIYPRMERPVWLKEL